MNYYNPNLQEHHAESQVVVFYKLFDVYIYRRADKSTINIFLKGHLACSRQIPFKNLSLIG